ncbi:MAG: hypothetical protein AB7F86_20015 [Bdellovibrionales bacterium]
MKPHILTLVVSVLLVTGCGSGGDGTGNNLDNPLTISPVSCDHRGHSSLADRQCRTWSGAAFASANLSVSCSAIESGSYFDGRCPRTNLVGVCVLNHNTNLQTEFYYYSTDYTVSTAEANCSNKNGASSGTGATTATWFLPDQFLISDRHLTQSGFSKT